MKNKLIGDRTFYKKTLLVVVPIVIQNGITNFVGLLDNIMVGRVGTEQMSGVAIVNQLIMVFNLCIFGVVAGAGIFSAPYFGRGDHEGVRYTFRFKILSCLAVTLFGILLFLIGGEWLIRLYLHAEGTAGQLDVTLTYGKRYLWVMLPGLLPFAAEQIYSGTLRECGETVVPMKAGLAAVCVNLVLNYLLIFGSCGFPRLGVAGAAAATVISRFVQAAILVVWTHRHGGRMPFIRGAYARMHVPLGLAKSILKKGTPLMINEVAWASGMAAVMQCYSVRGLSAVAALNICSTISNVFNTVFIAMGSAIAIIVGQLLGAGKMEEAKDTDTKLIACSVFSCVALGGVLALGAPLFPMIYNTGHEVKALAASLIRISAAFMPVNAFIHAAYFTLRSGGKTGITFLFDSVYVLCVTYPVAFVISRYTALPVVPFYLLCQMVDIIKCAIGYMLVRKNIWLHNLAETKYMV